MGRTILLAVAMAPSFERDGYELNWTRPTSTGPPAVRSTGNFNPTLAVVVSTVIIAFFLVGFAAGYVKRWIFGPEAAENQELNRQRRMNASRKPPEDGGLDLEVVRALPLVQYADLQGKKECEDDDDDCPVCLAVFEDSDRLRLLPHCAHAFHSECIDEWFRSHSTCPLCRACLEGANTVQDETVQDHAGIVDVVIQGGESSAGFSQEASTEPEQQQEDDDASITRAIRVRTVSSIRRSSSVGTGLQHNRVLNFQAIAMDQEQASTVSLRDHSSLRVLLDCKGGAGGLQLTRWSLPNLLQLAPP